MLIDRIAHRYALSLYQLAEEKNILNEVFKDAQKVNQILDASKDLSVFLKTPVVTHIRKIPILEKIFKPVVNESMMLFIINLARKAREELLEHIMKAFIEIYYKHHNITVVELITAKAMDAPVKQDLLAKIEKTASRQSCTKRKYRSRPFRWVSDPNWHSTV